GDREPEVDQPGMGLVDEDLDLARLWRSGRWSGLFLGLLRRGCRLHGGLGRFRRGLLLHFLRRLLRVLFWLALLRLLFLPESEGHRPRKPGSLVIRVVLPVLRDNTMRPGLLAALSRTPSILVETLRQRTGSAGKSLSSPPTILASEGARECAPRRDRYVVHLCGAREPHDPGAPIHLHRRLDLRTDRAGDRTPRE